MCYFQNLRTLKETEAQGVWWGRSQIQLKRQNFLNMEMCSRILQIYFRQDFPTEGREMSWAVCKSSGWCRHEASTHKKGLRQLKEGWKAILRKSWVQNRNKVGQGGAWGRWHWWQLWWKSQLPSAFVLVRFHYVLGRGCPLWLKVKCRREVNIFEASSLVFS